MFSALLVDRLRLDLDAPARPEGMAAFDERQQRLANALSRQPTKSQPVAVLPDLCLNVRGSVSTVRLPTGHRERDLTLQIWLPKPPHARHGFW